MNKTELLSTYTAEQLAEMVITAIESEESNEKRIELIMSAGKDLGERLNESMDEIGRLKSEIAKYQKALADAKKERDSQIVEYQEKIEELNGKLKIQITATTYAEEYVNSLKKELERSQTTINQIDEILEELFGVTHGVAKPNGFKEILREKVAEKIADFLPSEPIKVADMLISATYIRQKGSMGKILHKAFGNNSDTVTENVYSESELRQIAEHLLVYCNHNEGDNRDEE